MEIKIFQVDAFSDQIFSGNPAAICPLEEWLDDKILLNIAQENNLSETAFFIATDEGFHLRWFTPEIEMDLCGHATLASAHVIFHHLGQQDKVVKFQSLSGPLEVIKDNSKLTLDFPSRPPIAAELPGIILKAFDKTPDFVLKARDYLLVYKNEEMINSITPDQALLQQINLDPGGIIITAPGDEVDFVSRFFTPGASVFEDPVTGSAHCTLTPYWSDILGKKKLQARQISPRGGSLECELINDRVLISGHAKTYLSGTIFI